MLLTRRSTAPSFVYSAPSARSALMLCVPQNPALNYSLVRIDVKICLGHPVGNIVDQWVISKAEQDVIKCQLHGVGEEERRSVLRTRKNIQCWIFRS